MKKNRLLDYPAKTGWHKLFLVMKLTTFLVLALILNVTAAGYSQNSKVSVNVENGTLSEIFSQIEAQSNYRFFYQNEQILNVDRKSVDVNDKNVEELVKSLLSDTSLSYKFVDRNIIIFPKSDEATFAQQQIPVSGKVTDSGNAPLPGVTVVIKGTTNGTVTDADGKYSLANVPGDGVLVFSFVGMKSQEIDVAGQTIINVVLQDETIGLQEVVAIGYGTMKKSDLTGAITRANMTTLENSPNVNVLESLKGVVPGLNVGVATQAGENPTISIRGRNSISGTTSPLIVLDGIIYRGGLNDINPNDIQSVDVLKDASSTAIYGSQAANGVLMITTKTAKKMTKPIIEYNGAFTLQGLINNDMKRLDRDGFVNQLADIYISESRMGNDLLQRNPDFDVTSHFRDENVTKGYLGDTNTDWNKLLSNPTPYIQNHNLSLRGKSDLANYFLSFGYTDQKNMVKNDTYKRYNMRINLEAKVTDWFKVGTQSFFTINDFSGSNPTFSSLISIPSLVSPYAEDGSYAKVIYLGATNPLLSVDNPNKDVRNTLTGNFYADITIPWVQGLSYRMNYSNNLTAYKYFSFDPYANTLLGQAQKKYSNENEWTFDNILTYKRNFGKHEVNGTFVYGVEKRWYESTTSTANNFTNQALGYNYMDAAQADLNAISSSAWKESSLYTMVRAVYSYDSRYIFTGTIRRDGFSGFGTNHKFGYFPSAALAWRISEEGFLKNKVSWIDNLKLRLSYGSSGNRTAGRYATLAKISTGLPFLSGTPGGYIFGDGAPAELTQAVSTMANPNLKWETTTSSNFGVDFSLFGGKLMGNYEFYVSKTHDLLYDISIPNINGMFPNSGSDLTVPTNIGKLQNVGHELSVTGIPVNTKDFEWTVTGNFSTNKNKVVSILGFDNNGDGKEDDLISSGIFIGKPLGTVYDYNITGMWQVADYNNGSTPTGFTYGTYKIEDINNDGAYTADKDRKILGYTDPLYRFSIQNKLKYKDFELNVFINSIQGGSNHYLGQPAGDLPIPDHLTNNSFFKFDYWTPENPGAKYRQLGSYTAALGTGFSPYVSRSFIRLQELSLAYHLPKRFLGKLDVSRAKVYLSATNLLTITKWDGWDPEANQGLTYDLSGYPTMKGYTIGFNFEF